MNLFGGLQNYILTDFKLSYEDNYPHYHVELKKIHCVREKIEAVDTSTSKSKAVIEMAVGVEDLQSMEGKRCLDLLLRGVGRFHIAPANESLASTDMFARLAQTLPNARYYNLRVSVVGVCGHGGIDPGSALVDSMDIAFHATQDTSAIAEGKFN